MLQIGKLIKNKYRIIRELGSGRMSHTFLATDNVSKKVVVKVIQLKGLPEWKILELFEREAQILKGINHPRIPKYIDYFKEEKDDNTIFYLIYEYIEGTSLSKVIGTNYKLGYDDVKQILLQILDILDFLHSRFPPIIHRDINPNNIILDFDKNAYLVDFGASSILMYGEKEDGGSTFVGTYGYIPVEQMTGNPAPQSDIYSLGMTAIKLLTGENPSKFKMKNLKPDYLEGKQPKFLDRIIDKMIEMDYEKRPKNAKELINLIKGNNKSQNNNKIKKSDNNKTITSDDYDDEINLEKISNEQTIDYKNDYDTLLYRPEDEPSHILESLRGKKENDILVEKQPDNKITIKEKKFAHSILSITSLSSGMVSFITLIMSYLLTPSSEVLALLLEMVCSLSGIVTGIASLFLKTPKKIIKAIGILGLIFSVITIITILINR